MSTTTSTGTRAATAQLFPRILREGYGPGAWHGPDFKAALTDVSPELAFWRAQPGRHNIAEIALHHAFYAHSVRARITDVKPEPFPLAGEDWFPADGPATIAWERILALVESEQQALAGVAADMATGRVSSPLAEGEQLELVLGITCHAVYHAGQVQLIKRLRGAS
jgi:DinB family protein